MAARNVEPAEGIRTALNAYLVDDADPAVALAATFGAAPDLKAGRNCLHYLVGTRAELFAGTSASGVGAQLLGDLREVAVDRAIAGRAGRVRRETGIRLPDARIAVRALERNLELASRHTRDFERVRGLRLRQLG